MQWRFTLDPSGSPLVIDDPIGWDEAEIVYMRHDDFKGIFTQYITELTFHGSAYTYLRNKIDANNFCTVVYIKIEQKCSQTEPFTVFFNGRINLFADWCRNASRIIFLNF